MTKPLFIISASVACVDKTENANRNARLVYDILDQLGHSVSFIPSQGVYKGKEEQCYVVHLPEDIIGGIIPALVLTELAAKYNQESILFVDTEGLAYIVDNNGDVMREGPWTELPEGVDPDTDDYTDVDGVKYQIGKRIDFPELEGKVFRYDDFRLKVLGCNYDIGFTAYDITKNPEDSEGHIICARGPSAPGFSDPTDPKRIAAHTKFFDHCVACVQEGVFVDLPNTGMGSFACVFSS